MHEHHLMLNTIPAGHPGERRAPAEPRNVADTFRRAAAEAELLRATLTQFNAECDDIRCVVSELA
jgi:hypothetical protein